MAAAATRTSAGPGAAAAAASGAPRLALMMEQRPACARGWTKAGIGEFGAHGSWGESERGRVVEREKEGF